MSKISGGRQNGRRTMGAASIEMCSVRVGDKLFGVPITLIIEILGNSPTQAVPLAPSFVGGLVHYRGEVLTTVSLRPLLNMPPRAEAPDVLVFEGPGGYFGLQVDTVGEVLTVTQAEFEQNPATLEAGHRALFAGAYKLADDLLVMLDPEKLDPLRLSGALSA